MSRERELLERTIEEWDSDRDLYEFHKVIEEIRDFLSPPEPTQDEEPIYQISLTTGRATSSAWIDVEKDQYDDAGMYPEYARRTLFLHPAPRPEFVRLSEEEVNEILSLAHTPYEAICATENMLVRKNTINKSDPDSIDLQSKCRGDKL